MADTKLLDAPLMLVPVQDIDWLHVKMVLYQGPYKLYREDGTSQCLEITPPSPTLKLTATGIRSLSAALLQIIAAKLPAIAIPDTNASTSLRQKHAAEVAALQHERDSWRAKCETAWQTAAQNGNVGNALYQTQCDQQVAACEAVTTRALAETEQYRAKTEQYRAKLIEAEHAQEAALRKLSTVTAEYENFKESLRDSLAPKARTAKKLPSAPPVDCRGDGEDLDPDCYAPNCVAHHG